MRNGWLGPLPLFLVILTGCYSTEESLEPQAVSESLAVDDASSLASKPSHTEPELDSVPSPRLATRTSGLGFGASSGLLSRFSSVGVNDDALGVFVSFSGSDTSDCGSLEQPCQTFRQAEQILALEPERSARNFLFVERNTYPEDGFFVNHQVIAGYTVNGARWQSPDLTAVVNATGGVSIGGNTKDSKLRWAFVSFSRPTTPHERDANERFAAKQYDAMQSIVSEWALVARHGECVDLKLMHGKIPELAQASDPKALAKLLTASGTEAYAKEVPGTHGRALKLSIPSRDIAVSLILSRYCKEVLKL